MKLSGVLLLEGNEPRYVDELARTLRQDHHGQALRVQVQDPRNHQELYSVLTQATWYTYQKLSAGPVAWSTSLATLCDRARNQFQTRLILRLAHRMLLRQGFATLTVGESNVPDHQVRAALLQASAMRDTQLPEALSPALLNFAGHARLASFLMLGDRVNPKRPKPGWPFHAPGNSSLFLLAALERVGLSEDRLCFVNLNDPDGVRLAKSARRLNPALRPVVLGEAAETAWQNAGETEGAKLHHPQFYRRFHAHDERLERDLSELKAKTAP